MIICSTLAPDGTVGGGLGRAGRVAVAAVSNGALDSWEEHDVDWDRLHGEGTEGAHHARIVRFLREHDVEVVIARGIGPGMQRTLTTMGLRTVLGVEGDARTAMLQVDAGH